MTALKINVVQLKEYGKVAEYLWVKELVCNYFLLLKGVDWSKLGGFWTNGLAYR